MDVAQALTNLLSLPTIARTLSLPGPSTLTHEYLLDLVSSVTYNPPSKAPTLPKPVALALAKVAQSVWWPALSPDEVERRYIDDIDTPGDWDAVGVVPQEVETYAINYLRQYRSAYVYLCARELQAFVHNLHLQRELCPPCRIPCQPVVSSELIASLHQYMILIAIIQPPISE